MTTIVNQQKETKWEGTNHLPEKLQSITFSRDQKTRDQMTEIVADQEKGKFREMGLKLERKRVGFERKRYEETGGWEKEA